MRINFFLFLSSADPEELNTNFTISIKGPIGGRAVTLPFFSSFYFFFQTFFNA
jgi:hypothetical protein